MTSQINSQGLEQDSKTVARAILNSASTHTHTHTIKAFLNSLMGQFISDIHFHILIINRNDIASFYPTFGVALVDVQKITLDKNPQIMFINTLINYLRTQIPSAIIICDSALEKGLYWIVCQNCFICMRSDCLFKKSLKHLYSTFLARVIHANSSPTKSSCSR